MSGKIIILIGDLKAEAQLNDSPTAQLIWDALPIEEAANTWGDEIYFSIPVKAELEQTARDEMEKGELGYWPTGSAFCIFFGPTPASRAGEIRAASPVNPIGKAIGDVEVFKDVKGGARVRIEKG
ncbi:MAG: hypothetical protein GTN81_02265 [Proteobacteria bacterium]|nr:hypothetical protein [Pseudomonadota bacterium]